MSYSVRMCSMLIFSGVTLTQMALAQASNESTSPLDIDPAATGVLIVDIEKLDAETLAAHMAGEEASSASAQRPRLKVFFEEAIEDFRKANVEKFQIVQRAGASPQNRTASYLVFAAATQSQVDAILQLHETSALLRALAPNNTKPVQRHELWFIGAPSFVGEAESSLERTRTTRIQQALADGSDAAFTLVMVPSQSHKRVYADLTSGPSESAADGLGRLMAGTEWVRFSVEPDWEKITATWRMQNNDLAMRVRQRLAEGLQQIAPQFFRELSFRVQAEQQQGPQVTFHVVGDDVKSIARTILRKKLSKSQGVDLVQDMKYVALAMHNFHDRYASFPPSASYDENDRALLSWRVHLLPWLGERKLYNEFHLDEPWNSDHNRNLMFKIPSVYQTATLDLVITGKTTIVVPKSDKGIFQGEAGTPIKEIIDGTSNTILFVEAPDDQAVIWTQT